MVEIVAIVVLGVAVLVLLADRQRMNDRYARQVERLVNRATMAPREVAAVEREPRPQRQEPDETGPTLPDGM